MGLMMEDFPQKSYGNCIQPYTRDSKTRFDETSDILATFHFGSHGHGVAKIEKTNLSRYIAFYTKYVGISTQKLSKLAR